MNINNIPELKIGDLVAKKAIIQGGMGVGVSLSGLASAVANAGGIGVLASVEMGSIGKTVEKNYRKENIETVRSEIRKTRSLTKGVIGINVMGALTQFDEILEASIDEKIDVIFMGAGLPIRFTDSVKESLKSGSKCPTKFGVIVSSHRAAKIIFNSWKKSFNRVPDIVVVEGPKAGGHLGFKAEQIDDPDYSLENILPPVIETVKEFEEFKGCEIPVIAAGGIFTGEDIKEIMALGANGVQMATRFVATDECDASIEFKEAYVNCTEDDITIIKSPVGLPGRALKNKFIEDVRSGLTKPFSCKWLCLKTCDFKNTPYCIAKALLKAQEGFLDEGFAFAGANAWKVDRIISVAELFSVLEKEYSDSSAALAG
jgi:nitronate monooxygenase